MAGSAAGSATALGPHSPTDIRRYYAQGEWQHRALIEILAERAATDPDRVWVSSGSGSLTYAQAYEQSIRLAAGLARRGVRPGDRVAVQLPNWQEFAVITAAVSRLGAVLLPIMPIFRLDEVRYMLDHAGATVVIGPSHWHHFDHGAMYAQLTGELETLRHVVLVRPEGELPAGAQAFDDVLADGEIAALDADLPAPADPDEPFLIVYTSGTTSRPKGCHHTFNTVYAGTVALIRRLRVTQDDVFFNPSPVTHSTGLITGLLIPLVSGGGTHFQEVWDPSEALRRIARHRCSITFTATTFLTTLTRAYEAEGGDMSSMRYWVCAGAPIPGPVIEKARATFTGCAVLSLYGRSENFSTTLCGPDDAAARSATSDGRPFDGTVIRIVDRDGVPVPAGEEGDICYRGPSHMLGYYRDPAETALLYTADGLSRSGDLGYQDADGYVRVSGRVKDIIIRGGLNISSREIEDLLTGHPAVKDVAVVAMPDARLGEKACAFVVLMPGTQELTLAAVTGYLQERQVAVQKFPERLEIVDALPMTAVGKVRKNVLRDRIAAKLAAD
jgi:acyl-CoA synthetase (AMP-forming)/AMP-acid ligase II